MASKDFGSLAWTMEQLRLATGAAKVAFWSWNLDTDEIVLDKHACCLWGVPDDRQVTFRSLSERIHPADVERVGKAFRAVRGQDGLYEIDFCVLAGGEQRWISARGQAGNAGRIDRVMFAVFMDITARRQAEEAREMLAGEMSHRVKNLFAIASALTTIAARSTATAAEMAEDLALRLDALGQAHDLVLPSSGGTLGRGACLDELLAVLLAPYDHRSASNSRIRMAVPGLQVGETAVTTLALVVHELATNSIKYGALAQPSGILDLSCADHGSMVVLVWTERGGPVVQAPVERGFGSSLIARSMSRQLGGSIVYHWPAMGMIATLTMDRDRLAA